MNDQPESRSLASAVLLSMRNMIVLLDTDTIEQLVAELEQMEHTEALWWQMRLKKAALDIASQELYDRDTGWEGEGNE